MSGPVHYDVEAITAAMRQTNKRLQLPPQALPHNHIQHRNHEVSIQLMRMVLSENNAGSDPIDILRAVGGIVAEFIMNFTEPHDPGTRDIAIRFFFDHAKFVTERLLANDPRTLSAGIKFDPVNGGHA